MIRRPLIAAVTAALLAACGAATAQVTIQFGRGGVNVTPGYGYGYGYGNPYYGSGYNPYLGGAYTQGGRGDWYYDRYRVNGYGVSRGDAVRYAPNWNAYRNPSLYGPGGLYSGYGFDRHGHLR